MKGKRCPFCDKLNKIDHRFCVYCGRELPVEEINSTIRESQNALESEEFINCPKCNTRNLSGSVECSECGYLFDEDIKSTFHTSKKREYKRCPRCGSILHLYADTCSICGFEIISIDFDSPDEFFDNPLYHEYGKNRGFFKGINASHDYDDFLLNLKYYCDENGIDINFSKRGMLQCPECQHLFSFISPYFIKNHKCPHCSHKFDFASDKNRYCPNCEEAVAEGQNICKCGYELDFISVEKSYCLNCGRPLSDGEVKCECGYELADIRCPKCSSINHQTNNCCTSCGNHLQSSDVVFRDNAPKGCVYQDKKLVLDFDFLKSQASKNPYEEKGKVYTKTLKSEYSRYERIIDEISARWWITSPFNCKSCKGKIAPFDGACLKCNITHYTSSFEKRIRELKTSRNTYIKTQKSTDELSQLKWSYKLSESDFNDYLNSLAPAIGESQLTYRQRLFNEFWENSAILYIIKIIWGIYFKELCMGCLTELNDNQKVCPSCGRERFFSPLSVILNGESLESDRIPHQHDEFKSGVWAACKKNGGDLSYFYDGVVGCPNCSNYFHYMTHEFIDTRRCPHCGMHFDFAAHIYEDEWDVDGITYDEWMDMYGYRH